MGDETKGIATTSKTIEAKRIKLREFLKRDDAIDFICDNVANGGSIPSIAKTLDVPANWIFKWIRTDKALNKKYEQAKADRDEWEIETILSQLRSIASVKLSDILGDDGSIKPIHEIPEEALSVIESISVDDKGSKVKLINKLKALEMSGKKLGVFKEKVEHTGSLTLEQLVMGADYNDNINPKDVYS